MSYEYQSAIKLFYGKKRYVQRNMLNFFSKGMVSKLSWQQWKKTDNKKDGYRQQNVRQRQKLISIIDYDVCMTFY